MTGQKIQMNGQLDAALYLTQQAMEICDAAGFTIAAIHLCEAAENLKSLQVASNLSHEHISHCLHQPD